MGGNGAGGILLLIICLMIYFLPSAIAFNRAHHQAGAIFFLNLLLGWTFLCWVIAFVWACTRVERAVTVIDSGGFTRRAKDKPVRDCPHCAEEILAAAKVCKHCGRTV